MFRVHADDPHHTFAMDHLALIANLFDRRSYLHKTSGPEARSRQPGKTGPHPTASQLPADSSAARIALTQFHFDAISRDQPHKIPFQRAHQVGQNRVPVFQRD
jgi:hypothetical protein